MEKVAKIKKDKLSVVLRYYLHYALWIALALGFLTCEAVCELELPSYMSSIISDGIMSSDLTEVLRIGGIMLAIALASCCSSIIVSFLASRVGAGMSKDLRADIFDKVLSFSSKEYNAFSVSSLITRSTNDITQIQIFTIMFLRMVMYAPIMGIGGIIKAVNTASGISALGIVVGVALAVVVCVIIVLMLVVLPRFTKIQKQVDEVNRVAREGLTGMMVVRAFNTQKHEEERFEAANMALTKSNLFVNRVMSLLMPLITILMNGVSVATVWVAALFVEDYVAVANMMAFMQYAIQIIMSFMMISMVFILLPRAVVAMRRVSEVLSTQPSIVDPEGKENPEGIRLKGEIEFRDVREYNVDDLRRNIGFVPQKNILFSGTIASNLRMGDENATDEQLRKAAEIAQAEEFISEKPEGINDPIAQGGTNVSGGQKQRLAIARALVKKAPIYVFDDSFSALDFKTDAALRSALAENMKDSTVIIVAQRVGTIMNADRIIVLDDGRIAGVGTHRELLETCEVYNQIARSQLSEEDLKR